MAAMTLLGLPWMFWALFLSVALSCLIALAWIGAMDRNDQRRTKRAGVIPVCRELPRNINTATAWRRR
jgi:4-amino-4-deoxy-L-arabinose transferase-like glycosyltransferase